MEKTTENKSLLYYLAWIALGIVWMILQLPHSVRMSIGILIGKIAFYFPTQTKHTIEINLAICFPELSAKERLKLAQKNFVSLGIAFIESSMAWLLSRKKIQSLYTLQGYEHLNKAWERGKGILLITPHFTCVELVARFIGLEEHFGILYRPHKKPWLASIQHYFRKKHFKHPIRSDQIRAFLQTLKQNKAIWYAYDIDEGGKRSVFAPFFGTPAASLTTVSDIARLSNAAIVPMRYHRRSDNTGYHIVFGPALEKFPSNDKITDATRLNTLLEQAIRQHPEQYVWPYKRFKTRPKGQKRFYYSDNFPPRRYNG